MNKKTLTKLEYHKIIDILIEQATSFGGKERCKRLKPMTSITDIEAAQEQTAAAQFYGSFSLRRGRLPAPPARFPRGWPGHRPRWVH